MRRGSRNFSCFFFRNLRNSRKKCTEFLCLLRSEFFVIVFIGPGCHYERISQSQLLFNDVHEEKNCMYHDTSKFRKAYISKDTLYDTLVPMGYRNFKLRGRESSPDKLINEYLTYLGKPQCQDAIRHVLIRA